MECKTADVAAEWLDSRLASDVRGMVYWADGYVRDLFPGYHVLVTEVFYEKGEFGSTTDVHETWRGVDLVVVDAKGNRAGEKLHLDLADAMNGFFTLPAPGMKPAVYHTTGYGWHLHIQGSRVGGVHLVRVNR